MSEPKDPPKNVTLTIIPEEVSRVFVTFLPPDEPNGNISAYHVYIYRNGQLDFEINRLPVVCNTNKTMTAVIQGLKGGFNYSIQVMFSVFSFSVDYRFILMHFTCSWKESPVPDFFFYYF